MLTSWWWRLHHHRDGGKGSVGSCGSSYLLLLGSAPHRISYLCLSFKGGLFVDTNVEAAGVFLRNLRRFHGGCLALWHAEIRGFRIRFGLVAGIFGTFLMFLGNFFSHNFAVVVDVLGFSLMFLGKFFFLKLFHRSKPIDFFDYPGTVLHSSMAVVELFVNVEVE